MRAKEKKLSYNILAGIFLLGAAGFIIYRFPPEPIWTESAVVILIGIGSGLIATGLFSRKMSILLALGLSIFLILGRIRSLDPLTLLLATLILVGIGLL